MLEGSMSMCCYSFNLPVHIVAGADKHRSNISASRHFTSSVNAKPSSIVLRTEGSGGSFSESNNSEPVSVQNPCMSGLNAPVLTLSSTIGVIGGVSASSTLSFLEKLVKWSATEADESLPFIVCNDPVLGSQLSSCERASLPHLNSKTMNSHFDPSTVIESLRLKRLFLERSGARCIVMPCNISHLWHQEISEGCSVPFLHAGECVVKELKAAKLKPVEAGSNVRVGVLATDVTLRAGFYQENLQNQGFEVVLPDKATIEHAVIPAIDAFNRKDIEGARNLLRIALQVLLVRAVNTIILASDDMRGLLPLDDPLLKKCVDPMDPLIRSTIHWASSKRI